MVRFAGHGCVPESARGWCWLVCMAPRRAFPPVSASSFTRRAFPPVSPATLSLQSFSPLSLSSLAHSAHPQPLHFKVFLACVRPTLLSLNILPKCPAFRAMQDIYLTGCGSGFYVLSWSSAIDGRVRVLVFLSKWGRVGRRMDGYLVGLMEFSTDSLRSGDSLF